MSNAFDSGGDPSSGTPKAAPAVAPPAQQRGFFGRLLSALLIIVVSTLATLLVVGVALFSLGFSPDTAQQIAGGQAALATAQAQNVALQLQNEVIQTQIADLDRRAATDREGLDEVRREVAVLSGLRAELAASDVRSATAIAASRASGAQVQALATAEADRVALLVEVARRSERVERFLERLSDISGDAAQDLSSITATTLLTAAPTVPPTPTESASTTTPSPRPTATSAPTTAATTSAPTATNLPTPLATAATPSATPRP